MPLASRVRILAAAGIAALVSQHAELAGQAEQLSRNAGSSITGIPAEDGEVSR